MAAINSLLCTSCTAQINLLFRPPRSTFVGRRDLLRSPFMSIDNSAPTSSILGLDGSPLIVSTDTQSSAGSRQLSSEKDSGGGLDLSFTSLANAPIWTKLILGAVAILAIPFFGKLLRTEGALKNVEEVEKVVETAAEAIEKITKDIAEVLPEGEAKDKVLKLGEIAFLVDKNAEALDYFIDKIEDELEEKKIESKKNEGNQAKRNDIAGDSTKMVADDSHEKDTMGGPET